MTISRKTPISAVVLLLLSVGLVACSLGPAYTATSRGTATPRLTTTATKSQVSLPTFTPPTKCQAASPITTSNSFTDVQGTAQNAELWALPMPTEPLPFHAKQEVKIVWRMTGSGDIQMKAYNPNGLSVEPVWGPEEHGGSNWNRPGAEWGTGFNFPTPGCWEIHVERANAEGDVWFTVV